MSTKLHFVKKLFGIVFLTLFVGIVAAQGYKPYFTLQEMPDAGVFLPAPPAFESVAFADDFQQWQWGKSVRNTDRGKMASRDSEYGIKCMADIFGQVLDMPLSQEGTPAIWRLMWRSGTTGRYSVTNAKQMYMRTRPFVKMNEHVFGEYDDEESLRNNGSYPSGHTAFGWSVALALAEMAPEYQNEILRRGYQYGESRVIVGAHWQSDVDAARFAVAAALARLHTSAEYWQDLALAREEFAQAKGLAVKPVTPSYPDGVLIMGRPIDTTSARYISDIAQYWLAKSEREGERGRQAVMDADASDSALLNCFSPCIALNLSADATPAIALLLAKAKEILLQESRRMKDRTFRKRPYVQLGEETLIPNDEEKYSNTSSYPSASAAIGWGLALVLTEVAPEHQDSLMKRGFEYGRSRVIAGYHYASDVQAGRIMASYIYNQMHNNPEFRKLMENAQKEYSNITSSKH